MPLQQESVIQVRLRNLANIVGAVVILLASLSLLAHFVGLSFPNLMPFAQWTVRVSTSIGFLCLAVSLLLVNLHKSVVLVRLFASFAVLMGLMSLIERGFGLDFGYNSWLELNLRTAGGSLPTGPMGSVTAVYMILMGVALFLIDMQVWFLRLLSHLFTLTGALFGVVVLTGIIYGVFKPEETPYFSSLPSLAVILFVLVALGVLAARPNLGIMSLITANSLGGIVLRRTLPWAFVLPVLFGWIRLVGQQQGLYGTEFGLMLFAVSNILVFSCLVWRSSVLIHNIDRERAEVTERFEAVVEGSPASMVVVGAQGKILMANRQAEKAFGYSRAELLGQSIEILIPEGSRGVHQGYREAYVKAPVSRPMGLGRSLFGLRKDGTEFPVEIGLNPIHMGRKTVILGTIVDITERAFMESTLRLSEQRLRQMADSMPQMVWIAAPDGTVEYFNSAWEKFVGLVPSHTADFRKQILHPEDCEHATQVWHRSLETGTPYEMEYRFWDKEDSCYRWFLGRANPIRNVDGSIQRWIGTCTEIDDLKRAHARIEMFNAELEQKISARTDQLQEVVEALGASNRELDAFCYSISHDLRTPLRGIEGFTRLLEEDFGELFPAEARELFERVRYNSRKMSALIDDLLSFSRLGRQKMAQQNTNTGKIVSEVVAELKSSCDGREVEIREGELPACKGDPALLKQVWTNLLSNALKYSRLKDHAIIEIGAESSPGKNEVTYFVKDNGVGFDMRYADKLFGVFQRLHRQEDFDGTGVGLAIVQRILQRHGGRIWADATVDQGATFYFSLEKESSV